jgi:hypothetical protein
VFWVISVYFNIRNTLPKFGTFLLGHPVYEWRMSREERLWYYSTNGSIFIFCTMAHILFIEIIQKSVN